MHALLTSIMSLISNLALVTLALLPFTSWALQVENSYETEHMYDSENLIQNIIGCSGYQNFTLITINNHSGKPALSDITCDDLHTFDSLASSVNSISPIPV